MKYFHLVWAGLWRKKARTILTMLSIIVAFLLFGLLQGINQGFNDVVDNLDVNRLYISPKSAMDGLPISYQPRIKAISGVEHVSHWTYFGGFYREAKNAIPAFATDVPELFAIFKEIKIKPEYLDQMQRVRTGALVSDVLARQYGWKVGDRIPVGTSIWTDKQGSNTWFFDIVGTFDVSAYGMGFPSFYINYEYYDEAKAFGQGVVHFYLASIDDPLQGPRIAKEIDAQFENSMGETRTDTESGFAKRSLEQVGDINFIVNAIVGAVLFTLLFLTANTMMQSVRERIPELAVLKTLGFSDQKVLGLVLVESFILCTFAALIGLAIAALIFPSLKAILGDLPMPMTVVAMGAGLAIIVAIISGLPPAVRAQRLNIVDALAGR